MSDISQKVLDWYNPLKDMDPVTFPNREDFTNELNYQSHVLWEYRHLYKPVLRIPSLGLAASVATFYLIKNTETSLQIATVANAFTKIDCLQLFGRLVYTHLRGIDNE